MLDFGLHAFVMLFAVVDPLGNIPFFITITQDLSPQQRRKVAFRTSLVSWLVLTVFAIGGTAVLRVFRVTMPAVQIGGGIILLFIALRMLWGWQFDWERDHPAVAPGVSPADPAVVPLGMPLTAGPGAMASTLVLSSQGSGLSHLGIVLGALALVGVLTLAAYSCANWLMKALGRSVIVALSCLMGLVLAALAVQFMLDGLRAAMPGLFSR
jgi:multiple antibiotic resistance protein